MVEKKIIPVALSPEEWQAVKDRARIQGVSASSLLKAGVRIVLSQPIKKRLIS